MPIVRESNLSLALIIKTLGCSGGVDKLERKVMHYSVTATSFVIMSLYLAYMTLLPSRTSSEEEKPRSKDGASLGSMGSTTL